MYTKLIVPKATMRILILLSLVAVALFHPGEVAAQATLCRTDSNESQALIRELRRLMTSTDPDEVYERQYYYNVPVVDTTQVVLVTDAATCELASAAYGPPAGQTSNPSVYVIRLGAAGYAVLDPLQLAGDNWVVIVFDQNWVAVGGWTGG